MLIPKKYWISLLLCFCLVMLALCDRPPRTRKKGPRAPQWKKRSPPKKGENQVVVDEKKNLKLDCSAHGTPKPNINWTRNGIDINLIPNLKLKTQKHVLTVQNVRTKDSGNYTCHVFNDHGALTFTYVVRVTGHAEFDVIPPKNVTASVGQSATFLCRIKGNHSVSLQWVFKSLASLRRRNEEKETSSFLPRSSNPEVHHIQNVSYKDAGQYTCLAGNDKIIQLGSAWLTVDSRVHNNWNTMPPLLVSTWKSLAKTHGYAPEMGKKQHANETNEQSRKSYPAIVSIWTIYIIVGSVSGGVLFIGLITIIVAVCCQKENTGTYKSTNV